MSTVYEDGKPNGAGDAFEKVTIDWTCDASGDYTETTNQLMGYVTKVVTVPTDGPTADYDITLLDSDGNDVLGGAGADRHTTNKEQLMPAIGSAFAPSIVFDSALTLVVDNAGNAKSGQVIIYLDR